MPSNDQEQKQHTFDTVARHLRTQGRRAWGPAGAGFSRCMMRSPDGLKCSVGCLVPDELYSPDLEEAPFTEWPPHVLGDHGRFPSLLSDLMNVHDYSGHWDDGFNAVGEADLAKVARHLGLTYTPPAR